MATQPQLELSVRHEGESAVVVLQGELDLYSAAELRELLINLGSAGHHDIVLDLRDLTFIDSAGLGVLVGALRRARTEGGNLALVSPRPSVKKVLDVGGLSAVFDVRTPPRP